MCKRGDTHDSQHMQQKLKGDMVDTQEGVQDMRLGGSAREACDRHIKHLHGGSQAFLEALRHLRKTRMQQISYTRIYSVSKLPKRVLLASARPN